MLNMNQGQHLHFLSGKARSLCPNFLYKLLHRVDAMLKPHHTALLSSHSLLDIQNSAFFSCYQISILSLIKLPVIHHYIVNYKMAS
jgi:hypothetical protein